MSGGWETALQRGSALLFRGARWHADAQIIAARLVVRPAAVLIDAIDADAVQQVAVVLQPVYQRFIREQIVTHFLQVLRGKFVQVGGIAAAIAAERGQRRRE